MNVDRSTVEEFVVGCLLNSLEFREMHLDTISPTEIQIPEYQKVLLTIKRIYSPGKHITPEVFGNAFGSPAGSLLAVSLCVKCHGADYDFYLTKLREINRLDSLSSLAIDIQQGLRSNSLGVDELVQNALSKIILIEQSGTQNLGVTGQQIALMLKQQNFRPDDHKSVFTGFKNLDELTGGFIAGSLTYLGARTSMGKTTMLLRFIANALLAGKKVGFLSLEMTAPEVTGRIICLIAGVNPLFLRKKTLNAQEITLCNRVVDSGILGNLFIETERPTISRAKGLMKKYVAKHSVNVFYVDYLTLISSDKSLSNRHNEVDLISKGLQGIAKELNIPVIALVQLSRDCARVNGKKPQIPSLTDIREAGEEDADTILLMHRDDYYDKLNKPGMVQLAVCKNRLLGNLGKCSYSFLNGDYQEIGDIAQMGIAEVSHSNKNQGNDEYAIY